MKIIKRLKLQHKKLYVSLIVLLCMFSFDDTTATKSDLEIGDNNEPPSSSIRRQRRITLEWNQNKTQHDEIDCSRFENLEQLPPFCWNETTEAPAVRPPTLPDGILPPNPSPVIPPPVLGSTSPQYPNSDTGSIVPANNEIQVAVSMGVLLSPWNSLTETRLSEMGDLVSLVMTILLDRYSPFHVDDDSGNEAVPSETKTDNNNNDRRILLSDTNNQLRLQTQTQTKTQRLQPHAPEAATISSTKNKQQKLAAATSRTDPQKQQHEQRRRRQVTSVNQTTVDDDQIPWPRNASTASLPLENPEHVANLYLGAIIIKKTPLEDEQEIWYGAMVNYTVFWPNTVPISAPILLREITKACAQVLELSIESGHFWKELQLQDDSEKNLVVDDYAVDYHNEWGEIGGVAMVGEEYNLTEHWKNSTEENESTPPSGGNSTYPNPLGLEWQIREWLGLALLLITILTAGTLAFVAQKVILNKEHQQQLAHDRGCFLTEQGVAELLQVGWRYHHHHGGGGDDGQLFLQVFDKGVPSPSEDDYNHGEDNEDPDNHRQFPPQRILIGHQSNTPCHYNQRQ